MRGVLSPSSGGHPGFLWTVGLCRCPLLGLWLWSGKCIVLVNCTKHTQVCRWPGGRQHAQSHGVGEGVPGMHQHLRECPGL